MNIVKALPLFAGIGLFLFGMSILGSSLEKIAGAKLEKMLERLTSNRLKGVLLGTGVTAVIQSSSATTIMVVGLLNAGIISLVHAVPVIMGANIGTTITGQILRLGDLGDANLLLALLKPSSFGPILIAVGAGLNLFAKQRKKKDVGLILLGLGMIFFGMNTMEVTLSPLKDQEWFNDVFFLFENPLLGILLGAGMTAVLQSSSASVGILQALSSTGAITFSAAVPIILGQNVGKCVTVMLASIGSKKDAKRAVFIDVFTNVCGLFIFFTIIYSFHTFVGFSFWEKAMSRGNIADFHTLFNLMTSILLLPFIDKMINISKFFVKDKEGVKGERELDLLDDLLLQTPNVAIEQCKKAVIAMAGIACDNVQRSIQLLEAYSDQGMGSVVETENLLDRFETSIDNYIVKITALDIKVDNNKMATEMLHTVGDLERIGDHAMNIAEVAQYNMENDIAFSSDALSEILTMGNAVIEILKKATNAYCQRNLQETLKVEPLEEVIDRLQQELKAQHIDRLCEGKCSVQAGISFLELLTNFERIADHCSNIAVYIVQAYENNYHDFDAHMHLNKLHREPDDGFQSTYNFYSEKYKIYKEK